MNAMRDPVCGKLVTEETAQAETQYQGKRYLFCSRGCKVAFERDPEICLLGPGVEKTSTPEGVERWACGPEDKPEPRTSTAG